MNMKPQRRALGDWAVVSLYDRIFTGALAPGADLGEEHLCQLLDVSRATVGFALRQLEQDGLATVAAGNGRRQVAEFSISDIADLYDVRIALEGFAAQRAAVAISDESIVVLLSLQDEMEAMSRQPDRPTVRDFGVDFEFHRLIVRSGGSKRTLAALQPVWNQTHALLRHLYSVGAYGDTNEDTASYHDHRAIITALQRRDAEMASRTMIEHLSGRRDTLVAGLIKRGGLA